jgi:hypothetical protein
MQDVASHQIATRRIENSQALLATPLQPRVCDAASLGEYLDVFV